MPAQKSHPNPMKLRGVVVATVLPFTSGGAIDWTSYGRLLDYCAAPEGISAVFVNGHAGEGAALTPAERVEVIERTRRHIGAKPLLAGVISYSTAEAIVQARDAQTAGADCAVLFPLPGLGAGATATPRAPLAYVTAVGDAITIPLSIFQYPLASGLGFTTETLVEMARLPQVIAIKEGSDLMLAYEENWRKVKAARSDVAILPSNFDWFLAQLAVGGDGILSGLASLTPHWLVDLWRASEANDLAAMRAASDRLYPIVRSVYGASPRIDMHTRIKVGLKHLGIIANAAPRPPLMPVLPGIAGEVERAVGEAGLAKLAARVGEYEAVNQQAPMLHIVRVDIDPEHEAAFNRWYDEVHLPELLACPGWLSARRYTALDGGPKYVALYEIAGPWVCDTAEFHKAKGFREFEPHVRNFVRLQLSPIKPGGAGGPPPGH